SSLLLLLLFSLFPYTSLFRSHNIGSVFRTSDAFRIECIYLCGITAIPPHPEMHKTALGAEFTVDWKYVDNSVEAVDNLKAEGYRSEEHTSELQSRFDIVCRLL